jgi:hypothetical protein
MFSKIRSTLLLIGMVMLYSLAPAQSKTENEFEPSGTVSGKIFSNFNSTLQGREQQTAFEVRRAYFGYQYLISPEFSAQVKIDIGSPNDASQYSLLRRFGYFKTASVAYQPLTHVKFTFGLQDATQFKLQDKFWKRRYISESLMGQYKYGPSADIGVKAEYTTDWISVDFALFNGEGYSSLQNDNTFKGALGTTIRPMILPKTRLFGRFDKIDSNILEEESVPWNLAKDETAVTGGVEYNPVEAIKIAINYQDHYPAAKNTQIKSALYINLEASF